MRFGTVLLGITLLAAPAAALAQTDLSKLDGQTVIEAITPVDVVTLLQAHGYRANLGAFDPDVPVVESAANGLNFLIRLYGCSGAKVKSCDQLQLLAQFEREAEGLDALMVAYNREWVFGKAYLDDEGDMIIEYAVHMVGGITIDHLVNVLELWEGVMENFTITIDW